jgi:hypothetical protein
MIVRQNMEMKDDVKFVVDYCDTGSTLEIQTAAECRNDPR